ncbi:MAG: hypothetical protein A2782_04320 [Candidatus Blackburnbacteria bacterium RIFCSPHIGHO2_01_FULL_43_15b]|uniref:DUF2283 domain-containing protein n=1 Tax=Candidatus Blackburnbacteria bacterium RIFCSPHIGHO2_01_FULL_43_15b TaxID=1797513 RepID=A0A1G1V284_9BACT|nr:MAG: hypothetical protein A2782_04320 [Candidatus Blackburnbacteria bacterium RIFCSPHIGHO2_01_FULL_43_15b]
MAKHTINKGIYYEPEDDVLNIWFSQKKIDHAEETKEGMIVHFTKGGEPVYIEVLFASKLIKDIGKSLPKKLKKEIFASA